jgi:Ca-activated chloride channel family protein
MNTRLTTIPALVALVLGVAGPAAAQLIPPEPPIPIPGDVVISDYRVDVTIDDQIATTTITQILSNRGDWDAEAVFLHPLPPGAAITDLVLWIDGEPVRGEVLEAGEARQVYEEIVASLRDPALVEYADHGLVRASVFPIPPHDERKVELTYTQVLEADQGLVRYLHPFGREVRGRHGVEQMSMSIDLRSSDGIKAVFSPSHDVSVNRRGDDRALIGFEASGGIPDADFALYYSTDAGDLGLNVISFRDPTADDPSGFFVLLASPGAAEDAAVVAKDVIVVLDRSGSMEGEKFRQAQDAVTFVLDNLNPNDRFTVVTFSTAVDTFSDRLQPIRRAEEAVRWVEELSAAGSTDIDSALAAAFEVAGVERPTYVLFLTDGLPTEGVIDTEEILDRAARTAPGNARLFAFGVGWDVDTVLLDTLADRHAGTTTYVTPGEEIDVAVSALFAKVSAPVFTEPSLDFGDLKVFDLFPDPLPDLFAGEQLVLVGRYREGGVTDIVLRGMVGDEQRSLRFADRVFTDSGGSGTVPRLWATRKIGHLLQQVRIHGSDDETIDQIVRLSVRYGIVTPYTSYLVTEPAPFGETELSRISEEAADAAATTTMPTSGRDAVSAAEASGDLAGSDVAAPSDAYSDLVAVGGSRTMRWSDGVWIDTAFDPDSMTPIAVPFLSDRYFALAAADANLAAALAVGERVVVVWGGEAYEVVDPGDPGDAFEMPDTTATTAGVTEINAFGEDGVLAVGPEGPSDGGFPWWAIAAVALVIGAAGAGIATRLRPGPSSESR